MGEAGGGPVMIEPWLKEVQKIGSCTSFDDDEARLYYKTLMGLRVGASVLEVGCQYGRSTSVLMQVAPFRGLDVHLCDSYMEGNSPQAAASLMTMLMGTTHAFTFHRQRFENYFHLSSFHHFIMIDADHDYEPVKRDILQARMHLHNGGWLGFHDYGRASLPGVKQAVDEYLKTVVVDSLELAGTLLVVKEQMQ